jgi:hypothetical protein
MLSVGCGACAVATDNHPPTVVAVDVTVATAIMKHVIVNNKGETKAADIVEKT